MLGHGEKATKREPEALTIWRQQRKGLVTTLKVTERGTLTLWRPQKEGLVMTQKESDRGRGTHFLETTEGETCQHGKQVT